MADAFDQLPRASFDFIKFPVTKVQVVGGLRDHVHEYPHSPGGSPEKLGRRLYTFKLSAIFHDNLLPPWDESLWPGDLSDLFDRFEEGITSTLTVPTVGDIKAYCVNWSKEMVVRARSGETAELEFREDQASAFLIDGIINVTAKTLISQSQLLLTTATSLGYEDVFKAIADTIGVISDLADQAQMYDVVLSQKVAGINHQLARMNATLGLLNDPLNAVLLETFLDTWQLTSKLAEDIARQAATMIPFVVPGGRTMSVTDVSRIVYGDTSRAMEILQLNAIEDPFRISPGKLLRVYKPQTVSAAA